MKTIIEIRSAEGGQDSKFLVEDMVRIYSKACSINNFSLEVLQ